MIEAILIRFELSMLFGDMMMNAAWFCITNPFRVIIEAIKRSNIKFLMWLPFTLLDIVIFAITSVINLICFIVYFVFFPRAGCKKAMEISEMFAMKTGVTNDQADKHIQDQ